MPKSTKPRDANSNPAVPMPPPPTPPPLKAPSIQSLDTSPRESPYISDAVYLSFCTTAPLYLFPRTLLPTSILSNASYGSRALPGNPPSRITPVLALYNVDPDVAHTFVHYLYTGTYQTLRVPTPFAHSISQTVTEREHLRALLVYAAATEYGLDALRHLARERAESIDVPAWCVIKDVERAFRDLEGQDEWLDEYLRGAVEVFVKKGGEGERGMLRMELESTFVCSLLDAVVKVFGERESKDGWEMPLAPQEVGVPLYEGVRMPCASEVSEREGSDQEVVDLNDYLDSVSGKTRTLSEDGSRDGGSAGSDAESKATTTDGVDQSFVISRAEEYEESTVAEFHEEPGWAPPPAQLNMNGKLA
ncbi:hypothetical protein B0J12DRAFT_405490 [Macrophomina phaseolina]|uniref:BTB domain-containing protein n=1 Tax=Macrophomina phaseolina TaxID=35725 RepID=A0ABQ8GIV4_9PEZI|nr:hypothetical protein B0J12DRAFT_405490 [Macrophomina phaseolina]